MLRVAPCYRQFGSILIVTLLMVLVLSLLTMAASSDAILENKMKSGVRDDYLVTSVAENSLQKAVLSHEGVDIQLPDSSVTVSTQETNVKTDRCDNQTIDFLVTAQDDFSTVVLNSRDTFAKVPKEKNCAKVPIHRRIWWKIQ